MQLIHQTTLSVDDYIYKQTWQEARLECCPNTQKSSCQFHRHGTYSRKTPSNIRIARYYCRTCQMTFSLLPSFMAAGKPGTPQAIEEAALAIEECSTLMEAHNRIRPDHHGTWRTQRRWFQRRSFWLTLTLYAVRGLFPEFYAQTPMTVGAFRAKGVTTTLLVTLRKQGSTHLQYVPPPVGFRSCSHPIESQTGPPTQGRPC